MLDSKKSCKWHHGLKTFNTNVVPGVCPQETTSGEFLKNRMNQYIALYNVTSLPEDWWGWKFMKSVIKSDLLTNPQT